MKKTIYIKNKKYIFFDTYDTWEEAHSDAKHYKKKDKAKWLIIKTENGLVIAQSQYLLYLTNIDKLW